MPRKGSFRRRVVKHSKTLLCECGKEYTRADYFEKHKEKFNHHSAHLAAALPSPNPLDHTMPFWCACGSGFWTEYVFNQHCHSLGHKGDWERSRYQPQGLPTLEILDGEHDEYLDYDGGKHVGYDIDEWPSPAQQESEQLAPISYDINLFEDEAYPESPVIEVRLNADPDDDSDPEDSDVGSSSSSSSESSGSDSDDSGSMEGDSDEGDYDGNGSVSEESNSDNSDETDSDKSLVLFEPAADIVETSIESLQIIVQPPTPESPRRLLAIMDSPDRNEQLLVPPTDAFNQATETSTTPSSTGRMQKRGGQISSIRNKLRKSKDGGINKCRRLGRNVKKFVGKHKWHLGGLLLLAAAACTYSVTSNHQDWILDTTAPQHVARDPSSFLNRVPFNKECHLTRRGLSCGSVPLKFKNGQTLMLDDVLYLPRFGQNTVSLHKLSSSGISGHWTENEITIVNGTSNELIGSAVFREGRYYKDGYMLDGLAASVNSPDHRLSEGIASSGDAPTTSTSLGDDSTTSSGKAPAARFSTARLTVTHLTASDFYDSRTPFPDLFQDDEDYEDYSTPVITLTSTDTLAGSTKESTTELTPTSAKLNEGASFTSNTTINGPSTSNFSTKRPREQEETTQSSYKKARTSTSSSPSMSSTAPSASPWIWSHFGLPAGSPSVNATIPIVAESTNKSTEIAVTSNEVTTQDTVTENAYEQGLWDSDTNLVTNFESATDTIDSFETNAPAEASSTASPVDASGEIERRVDAYEYVQKKLAEAKEESKEKYNKLKKRLGIEDKECPPCPPCPPSAWRLPRFTKKRLYDLR